MKNVSATLAGLVLLLAATGAEAQKRKVPIAKRCVDKVVLRDGPTLYGAIMGRAADGAITIAVERDWLKTASSKFYEQHVVKEAEESGAALVTLRDRLKEWIDQKADEKRFATFLLEELIRVEQELKKENDNTPPVKTQFLIVEIPSKQVKQGYVQPRRNRQLAVAAWKHRLPNVETLSVTDLVQQLRKKGIDVSKQQFDLSDRLPRRRDSERQWAARRAIVEHHFGHSLQFQGTGNFLVQTGDEAKQPALTELLTGMIQQQLGKELADLLGTALGSKQNAKKGLTTATSTADEKKISAVIITRMEQNLQARKVSVEKLFLAKMPDGKWETVWKHVQTADASQKRPEIENNLAEHPQIKQLLNTVKSLGLPAGEEQIRAAIRFGAATSAAQQKAEGLFFEFEKRYVQRLDGPPLIFPAGR